jgi:hypothetical protein
MSIVEEAYELVKNRVKEETGHTEEDMEKIASEAVSECYKGRKEATEKPVRLTIHHHQPTKKEKLMEWLGRVYFELCLFKAKKRV